MGKFWACFIYCASIGILAHYVGLALSNHHHFRIGRFPWRALSWEREGRFWQDTLNVRGWMNSVPDMSRIMSDMVPKRLDPPVTVEKLDVLIRETCVAEMIHWLLTLFGFGCLLIWKGIGGLILSLMFAFGNLPFVIIQRYNRPSLMRLRNRLLRAKGGVAEVDTNYTEVRHI